MLVKRFLTARQLHWIMISMSILTGALLLGAHPAGAHDAKQLINQGARSATSGYCTQSLSQWEHDGGNPPNGPGRFTGRTFSKSYTGGYTQPKCLAGVGVNQPTNEIRGKLTLTISSCYDGCSASSCWHYNNGGYGYNPSTATLLTIAVETNPTPPCGYGYYATHHAGGVVFGGSWYDYSTSTAGRHHFPS